MPEVIGSTTAGCPKNGGVLSDSIVYFCQELREFKNFSLRVFGFNSLIH